MFQHPQAIHSTANPIQRSRSKHNNKNNNLSTITHISTIIVPINIASTTIRMYHHTYQQQHQQGNPQMSRDIPDNIKIFNIRMEKDLWVFLKTNAAEREIYMTDIVIDCLTQYRKKVEKKLTQKHIDV